MKTVEEQWKGFARAVFGNVKPTLVQYEEMKKAFFAGAWSMLCAMEKLGEADVTEDDGVLYLQARKEELLKFNKKILDNWSASN